MRSALFYQAGEQMAELTDEQKSEVEQQDTRDVPDVAEIEAIDYE